MRLAHLVRTTAAAIALSLAAQASAATLGIIVPAYFHPATSGDAWARMASAATRTPLVAILNPASGPGTSIDPYYPPVISAVQASGGRVIGYVSTAYGERGTEAVLADIDAYVAFYNIDGIFLDEMATDEANLSHYADLYAAIKSAHPEWLIVGNPGTNTQETYLQEPAADVLVVFEDRSRAYTGWAPAPWTQDYPTRHFAHLVHTARNNRSSIQQVSDAANRHAGYVYVTNDGGTNPWDTLPSYWDQEVRCVVAINDGRACN